MSEQSSHLRPPSPERAHAVLDLLGLVVGTAPGARVLIGIDGPAGVGKSHLSAELQALAPLVAGREVRGISLDGFHHPRAVRHGHGDDPESHYRHAYDHDAFDRAVVTPFRAGREIVPAVRDVPTDERIWPDPLELSDDAVLLVDGLYLCRPELIDVFDRIVLVHAPLEVTVPRDNARWGHEPARDHPDHPANSRYVGAWRRYAFEARTAQTVPTWRWDNTDLERPVLEDHDPERFTGFDAGAAHPLDDDGSRPS